MAHIVSRYPCSYALAIPIEQCISKDNLGKSSTVAPASNLIFASSLQPHTTHITHIKFLLCPYPFRQQTQSDILGLDCGHEIHINRDHKKYCVINRKVLWKPKGGQATMFTGVENPQRAEDAVREFNMISKRGKQASVAFSFMESMPRVQTI